MLWSTCSWSVPAKRLRTLAAAWCSVLCWACLRAHTPVIIYSIVQVEAAGRFWTLQTDRLLVTSQQQSTQLPSCLMAADSWRFWAASCWLTGLLFLLQWLHCTAHVSACCRNGQLCPSVGLQNAAQKLKQTQADKPHVPAIACTLQRAVEGLCSCHAALKVHLSSAVL